MREVGGARRVVVGLARPPAELGGAAGAGHLAADLEMLQRRLFAERVSSTTIIFLNGLT